MDESAKQMDEKSLTEYLAARAVRHKVVQVGDSAHTASQAARALGVPLPQIVKSLVCQAGVQLLLVMVPGDRELSLSKLGLATGTSEHRLASRRQVEQVTGYPVGGVAPVGLPPSIPVLADVYLADGDVVYCGGGSETHLLRIAVADLERLTGLRWFDLSCDASNVPAEGKDRGSHLTLPRLTRVPGEPH